METVKTDELRAKIALGDAFILVDVRGAAAYEEEHIPQAHSVPLDQMAERIGKIAESDERIKDKDFQIVVCSGDATCTMSDNGGKKLEEMGYTNVSRYTEGLAGWKAAGLRTRTPKP